MLLILSMLIIWYTVNSILLVQFGLERCYSDMFQLVRTRSSLIWPPNTSIGDVFMFLDILGPHRDHVVLMRFKYKIIIGIICMIMLYECHSEMFQTFHLADILKFLLQFGIAIVAMHMLREFFFYFSICNACYKFKKKKFSSGFLYSPTLLHW